MYGMLDEFNLNDARIEKELETILRTVPSYVDILLTLTMGLIVAAK